MSSRSVHPEAGWILSRESGAPAGQPVCACEGFIRLMYCVATEALPCTKTWRTDEIANLILPLPKRREKITCYLRQHWLLLGYSESIYKITISCACITGFYIYNFPLVSSVDMPVRWPSSHLTSLPLLPLDYAKNQCDYFCFLKSQ